MKLLEGLKKIPRGIKIALDRLGKEDCPNESSYKFPDNSEEAKAWKLCYANVAQRENMLNGNIVSNNETTHKNERDNLRKRLATAGGNARKTNEISKEDSTVRVLSEEIQEKEMGE